MHFLHFTIKLQTKSIFLHDPKTPISFLHPYLTRHLQFSTFFKRIWRVYIAKTIKEWDLDEQSMRSKCFDGLLSCQGINIFKMRRQAYYLPNLNCLMAQNRQLARHRQRIKLATSQYHLQPTPTNDSVEIRKESPFQKRQRREQELENARMSKAMQSSNPTIIRCGKEQEEAYSSLKHRIRKFTTEGNAVKYKFEKSLKQLELQRQDKEQHRNQRVKELHERLKQGTNLPKQATNQQLLNNSISQYNDIFYQAGDSLCLQPTRKLTINHPRSLTPQNFLHYAEEGKGRTQKIRVKTSAAFESQTKSTGGQAKSSMSLKEDKRESRSRYKSDLYSQINKSIRDIILSKTNRIANPETSLKGKQKALMDLQIITIAPVQ